ncbi:MAG: hypothetical protein WDA24_00665 [Tissierellales bacterium]
MHKEFKATLLLAAIILIFSLGFSGETYAEAPFEVKTNIGFNGFYKYEYVTPINIEVKNNERDVNGKIQILFENGTSNLNKKVYTAYTKELDIAKGATKTISMELKLDRRIGEYKIRILDKNDRVIWEDKSVAMPNAKASNVIGVGVLSDEFESLWYLPLMTFSNSDEKSGNRASAMSDLEGHFPTDARFLNMLDVIIINNYNTEKLTIEEKDALIKWLNNGGTLLIGTGPSYNKTLKGLEDINYINVSGTTTMTELNNMKDSSGNPFVPNSPLTIVNATSSKGSVILEEGSQPIIFSKDSGNGKIIISAFDLGLSPFVDWSGKDKFVQGLLAGNISGTPGDMLNKSNQSYRFFNINQYIPSSKAPSAKVIIAILMIFTLIVGPINYLILRKIDKREMGWVTIPALAVTFSLVMLIWGSGTSFKNPLMNNVSIISFHNNMKGYDVNTFAGVISFKNGDVNITSSENTDIFPNDSYNNNQYMNFENNDITLEYILQKNKTISFKGKGVWDVQQIELTGTKNLENGFTQDLILKGNTISGEIKNNSGIDLNDAILFYGLDLHKLGDIKNGESKSINNSLNSSTTTNQTSNMYRKDMYQVLESIYPWNRGPMATNNQDTILTQDIKREILEGFFQNSTFNSNKGTFLIGWNTDNLSSDITVNGKKVERIDRNIIAIPIDLNYEKGEVVEIPHGILSPQVLENTGLHYDPYDKSFHGQGSVVMSVKSDEKIEFNEININISYGGQNFNNKVWVFNYETNEWDEHSSFTILINDDNKSTYYDEANGTKIKIDLDGRDNIWMPTFSVKGVAK